MVKIFTDGSCNSKSRYGGYGVFVSNGEDEDFISIGYSNTTISRMEMRAILHAIRYIKEHKIPKSTIYSDSQFCVNSLTKGWVQKWVIANWVGTKNSDIWKQIYEELLTLNGCNISIIHTRGHQKDLTDFIVYGNNVADILADYKNFDKYIIDET